MNTADRKRSPVSFVRRTVLGRLLPVTDVSAVSTAPIRRQRELALGPVLIFGTACKLLVVTKYLKGIGVHLLRVAQHYLANGTLLGERLPFKFDLESVQGKLGLAAGEVPQALLLKLQGKAGAAK